MWNRSIGVTAVAASLILCSFQLLCRAEENASANNDQTDRRELLRRTTLDLLGRVPTDPETQAFLDDKSPDARAHLAERLAQALRGSASASGQAPINLLTKENKIPVLSDVPYLNQLFVITPQASATYLGVGVEAPGPALRSQLKLPEGAGLVVNYVDAEGPAKDAIKQHDVLQKLDDQILINGEQLQALVRMHSTGQGVSVSLIREAQPVKVTVKLGQKEGTTANVNGQVIMNGGELILDGSQKLNNVWWGQNGSLVYNQVDQGQNWSTTGLRLLTSPSTTPISFDDGSTVAFEFTQDGKKALVVVNKADKRVLFSGPIETEEQWKAVPEPVRQKLRDWQQTLKNAAGSATQPASSSK